MPKKTTTYDFFDLFDKFMRSSKQGRRLQKNGKRIRKSSIDSYLYLRKLLAEFSYVKDFKLEVRTITGNNESEFKKEQRYWIRFHKKFTDFLYDDKKHFDNYVSSNTIILRAFFNYLNNDLGLYTGNFHKKWPVLREEIQIVTLTPNRLSFLINNRQFEDGLPERLQKMKDIFVFGCTVGLRTSDLMKLNRSNLEHLGNKVYLKNLSQKTQRFTRIKLPDYCIEIIQKYNGSDQLLPWFHSVYLNKYAKELCEWAGWTEPFPKIRQRRGLPVEVYANDKTKESYRFCDLVTSHTMRRTAITTLLCLGLKEELVRNISGHAPGSKEFWKYVAYSQTFVDKEVDAVYKKLKSTTFSRAKMA